MPCRILRRVARSDLDDTDDDVDVELRDTTLGRRCNSLLMKSNGELEQASECSSPAATRIEEVVTLTDELERLCEAINLCGALVGGGVRKPVDDIR